MKNILTILSLIFAININAQHCNCDSLFLQTQKIVEENYASWFDKVTENRKSSYTEWSDKHYS